ncbi:hypothetical protein JOB18_024215 [Solea senegalensis]|uniref:Uncharacterized protein n=1 Tax=Solea senegalensis TaxID=28829 RepID=A0AAV6S8A5_SOLSE|nr:hypothetical protein JOB18_024215 [Solea senegalensis]
MATEFLPESKAVAMLEEEGWKDGVRKQERRNALHCEALKAWQIINSIVPR